MEELLNNVLEEFEVTSEEELLNNYGTKDFYKKAKEGRLSYSELICLGYLEVEDVTETLGTEKALSEGIISKEEAEEYKKEVKLGFKGNNLEELLGVANNG